MEEKKLNLYFTNEKILSDLCQQLTKDIAVEGFEIKTGFPLQQAFEQLFNQLLPLIRKLEKDNKAKLNFILNRADISESQLVQSIQKNKAKPYAELVAELIIKRELQKVVIRNMQR
ncbi:MAG: hypothetical protein ABUT20_53640 [Bacteroidota bacterium]